MPIEERPLRHAATDDISTTIGQRVSRAWGEVPRSFPEGECHIQGMAPDDHKPRVRPEERVKGFQVIRVLWGFVCPSPFAFGPAVRLVEIRRSAT